VYARRSPRRGDRPDDESLLAREEDPLPPRMFGTPMNIPLAEITNFEESINRLVSRKLPASLPEHGSDSAADERFREMSKAAKAKIAAESTSRFERAKALLQLRQTQKAVEEAEKLLCQEPDNLDVMLLLGQSQMQLRQIPL
jgi:hypothetical protein